MGAKILLVCLLLFGAFLPGVFASITVDPGFAILSRAGGGDITFAYSVNATGLTIADNYATFTNFIMSGITYPTFGLDTTTTNILNVTEVYPYQLNMDTNSTGSATIRVALPARATYSALNFTSWSYSNYVTALAPKTGPYSTIIFYTPDAGVVEDNYPLFLLGCILGVAFIILIAALRREE